MGTPIRDEELIRLIESYPILYDKDLARGARNAQKKDDAWRMVSENLKASERACITRWKSIRDRFGKEYRRFLENPDEPVTWDMFPHLMFLKNHYKHGYAKDDALPVIKYEPKPTRQRRQLKQREVIVEEESNEEEIDAEEHFANQRLIQLVKEREVIYDKLKIRDSKNLTAKNDAWQQISESMGISEEICYKRWKKLRDRFARECRNHHIYPDEPVRWIYFNDLTFLEGHYRKGVPLDVSTIKRSGRPRKTIPQEQTMVQPEHNDSITLENFTYECIDQENIINDESQDYVDIKDISFVEYNNSNSMMPTAGTSKIEQHSDNSNQIPTTDDTEPQPVEQLCAVIDNIEAVLQQSQDCLLSLRQQQKKHQKDLETLSASANISDEPPIVQKMHVLLEGLSAENRSKAEVKIVKFLCECQIKTLNQEDIHDVRVSNIK